MFWGLLLKANKRYSQVVQKAFHISHATLDVKSGDSIGVGVGDEVVQVWVHIDDTNHLLCNLNKQTSHVSLDLAFSEGENISFFSKGTGVVHLTGFLLPDESDEFDFGGEEEIEGASDDEVPVKKGKKAIANEEDEESSELDEDELLGEEDDEEEAEDEEEDDENDNEDDEDEDDDDDEDEDEEVQPPAKVAKIDKSAKLQNGLSNGKAASKTDAQQQQQQKKDKKKEKPQPNASQNQPNATQPQQQQAATSRTLKGGVIVEDLRRGKGQKAKDGKKVSVYYEGRLKTNNKVFDSTKAGDGFKFHLGRGEVIRGWDIGLVGMQVGGKRRITCPPNCAYGAKGQQPTIPGNATLVFDVELRGVN